MRRKRHTPEQVVRKLREAEADLELDKRLLKREQFDTPKEAKVLVEDYRLDYNDHRPHSS